MSIATPSPSNDAALNAQLDITRDASIANLEQKSSEVQQQYRNEAAQIADQKQRSAEVVQGTINAARENDALKAEADFRQAVENAQAVEDAVYEHINAPADGGPKRINYNRLTGVPLHLEADLLRTSQLVLKARDAYLDTHPQERDNPMLDVHIGEDGFAKYGSELQAQVAIASPDESRAMPLDELRQLVQRKKNGIVQNADKPPVSLVDQPDGTFNVVLQSGETFKGFPQSLKGENREAIRRLAEGRVSTQQYYQSLLEQAVAQQQPDGQQSQPQAQPANNPAVNENPSLTDWFLDETAKRFGYQNGSEMVADQNSRYQREQQNNAVLEQYKNERTVQEFFANHPEYPNSDQANNAIEQIINRNGWEWTPDTMAAAHALAVQNRVYQPLTQEEIAVSNGYAPPAHRRAPPPMVNSNNPDTNIAPPNLWTEPLDQQRKRILDAQRAELQGGR